jgi:hypothetical protein
LANVEIDLESQQRRRDFELDIEAKLRESMQPQLEQVVGLLETDLRGLWPQLHDMIDQQLASASHAQIPQRIPDFARQRRELLQAIQLAVVERIAGKSIEEQLTQIFHETSNRLRLLAGVATTAGIVALIAAMESASVAAALTGLLAAAAAVIGIIVAFMRRQKIQRAYRQQVESKRSELVSAIGQQFAHAIDQFYKEVSTDSQPLASFCLAQRRIYEPLLKRVGELQRTFDGLKSRLR